MFVLQNLNLKIYFYCILGIELFPTRLRGTAMAITLGKFSDSGTRVGRIAIIFTFSSISNLTIVQNVRIVRILFVFFTDCTDCTECMDNV